MPKKDILWDDDMDIRTPVNGNLLGVSDLQHQKTILLSQIGENRMYPKLAVGIQNYLGDDNEAGLLASEIQKNFESDGMNVKKVKLNYNGQLEIIAPYK